MAEITLTPMTRQLCHEFFSGFENDADLFADMSKFQKYVYDEERVNAFFEKQQAKDRIALMVLLGERPIGQIIFKQIDGSKRECTLSIHMQNDQYKGRGYGTRAEQLAVEYALNELKMKRIHADTILKNKRSQHVLEKVGFRFVRSDGTFYYYVLER